MKILAIDPGVTTGIALLEDTRGRPEVTFSRHIQYDDLWSELKTTARWGIIRGSPYEWNRCMEWSDHIVIENYRLYASKAAEQINSEFETVRLIGALQLVFDLLFKDYSFQMAHQIKVPLLSDSNLEERWGIVLNNRHERDAARHALLYWLRHTKKRAV